MEKVEFTLASQTYRPADIPRWMVALQSMRDTIAVRCEFSLVVSPISFLADMTGLAQKYHPDSVTRSRGVSAGGYDVIVEHNGETTFYADVAFDEDKIFWEERRLHFKVNLWGASDIVRSIHETMLAKYGRYRLATIRWWYSTKDGATYRSITMEEPPRSNPLLFPWLGHNPQQYFDRYMASDASILFMMGPPGTGKSSLLRQFVFDQQITAFVTYDEKLLASDEMFVSFLATDGPAVMIVEDAETLVVPRRDGNGLMARFLNASDGLVRSKGKKLIFTTNQDNFRRVDEALLRPGRAFDSVVSRALTYEEACAAADAIGIPRPREHRDVTLGQLFNPDHREREMGTIGIG